MSTRSVRLLVLLVLTGAVAWGVFVGFQDEELDTSFVAETLDPSTDAAYPGIGKTSPSSIDDDPDPAPTNAFPGSALPGDQEQLASGNERTRVHDPSDSGSDAYHSAESQYPDAAEIDRAIERALAIKAIEAGIRAARADPRPPPAIARAMAEPVAVPVELEQAPYQPKTTPPEILEMMREIRETPPDIAQAMAEAKAKGTSDELRAYMAGEISKLPEN